MVDWRSTGDPNVITMANVPTLTEFLQRPIPPNTDPARRHCYEVACDMMFCVNRMEQGLPMQVDATLLRAFIARLLDGVDGRYGTAVPDTV